MNYTHAPRFRMLTPASHMNPQVKTDPQEDYRDGLLAAATCLSIYARIHAAAGITDETRTAKWNRLATFLDEVSSDLRDDSPIGDRAMGWASVLTMVSDHLELEQLDEEYEFLLSVFIQACCLVEISRDRSYDPAKRGGNILHGRIRASLDFIVDELAERRRRHLPRPVYAA